MLGRQPDDAQQLGHALALAAAVQAVQRSGSARICPTSCAG
jgi:hypothetical protein